MLLFPAFFTGLGWPEIVLVLALVLVLFGPKRLPEIAEAMGKSIRRFKSATNDATRDVKRELDDAGRDLRNDPPASSGSASENKSSDDNSSGNNSSGDNSSDKNEA
jgi:sec-independent protein translocase protein TatA